MELAERVGGWDTGPGAIGDYMHMYLKCFFALSGRLDVKIVSAAASQCNVSSDVEGLSGYIDGLHARYKQALRHMWGAMDSGYAIRETVAMISRHRKAKQGAIKRWPSMSEFTLYIKDVILTSMSTACKWSLVTFENGTAVHQSYLSKSVDAESTALKPINILNVLVLFHRLFEAHFLPIHLGLILTTTTVYNMINSSLIPRELALALSLSGFFRFIGWSLVCLYFYRYAAYHRLCVDLRREEMKKAGLLDDVDEHGGLSKKVFGALGFVEAALFPIGGFVSFLHITHS